MVSETPCASISCAIAVSKTSRSCMFFRSLGSTETVSAPKHQNWLQRTITSLNFSACLFSIGLLNTTSCFCHCLHMPLETRQMFFSISSWPEKQTDIVITLTNWQLICHASDARARLNNNWDVCCCKNEHLLSKHSIWSREDWAKEAVAKAKMIGGDMSLWRRDWF